LADSGRSSAPGVGQLPPTFPTITDPDRSVSGAPNAGTNEVYGGEVIFRAFVVASGDASEVFETVEEAFEIALRVEPA
jgi:hypothetical protein